MNENAQHTPSRQFSSRPAIPILSFPSIFMLSLMMREKGLEPNQTIFEIFAAHCTTPPSHSPALRGGKATRRGGATSTRNSLDTRCYRCAQSGVQSISQPGRQKRGFCFVENSDRPVAPFQLLLASLPDIVPEARGGYPERYRACQGLWWLCRIIYYSFLIMNKP